VECHAFKRTEIVVKNLALTILIAGPLLLTPAVAAERAADPDLSRFREAYTTGDGLAYVVVNDAKKGEQVYRYGDASRMTAKKDARGYMLFTCASPHVFIPQKPEDKATLLKAEVVKAGDPRFAELDAKYLANCHNPLVKSAIQK
jgi:hypothetical protein